MTKKAFYIYLLLLLILAAIISPDTYFAEIPKVEKIVFIEKISAFFISLVGLSIITSPLLFLYALISKALTKRYRQ